MPDKLQAITYYFCFSALLTIVFAAIFTPFARSATQKSLQKCILLSLEAQAISVQAYAVLAMAIAGLIYATMKKMVPAYELALPALFISLFTVLPLSNFAARKVLRITEADGKKIVRSGNVVIAAILWISFFLISGL